MLVSRKRWTEVRKERRKSRKDCALHTKGKRTQVTKKTRLINGFATFDD